MSKRKKNDPNPEEEEDDDDTEQDSRDKQRQQKQQSQKVYDFHKKTIEVYPERLRELNRQFLSSISSQITNEPYTVLVGNCLDYVRQYFNYEDDLLKYSPWLAARLKQSRSDIAKCLQETIDVYEALARNDFDRIIDKTSSETLTDHAVTKETNSSMPSTAPILQFRPITTATTISATTATVTTTTTASTTTASSSLPLFSFTKPTSTTSPTIVSESTPSTGFSFKLATTTMSPEKTTTNPPPFSFSLPTTGFGTSTLTPINLFNPVNKDKPTATSSASSISFLPPPSISFVPPPSTSSGEQTGTAEDNEDEPSEPPEPEKVEHEADAKLTYRCRMGVTKDDKLIKRGPVQVVLKEVGDKRQLIVRSDDTLGRLFLNILWCKLIKVSKRSSKDLTFVCRLNPSMPEFKEGEFVTILFRFDTETERNDAFDKLEKEQT